MGVPQPLFSLLLILLGAGTLGASLHLAARIQPGPLPLVFYPFLTIGLLAAFGGFKEAARFPTPAQPSTRLTRLFLATLLLAAFLLRFAPYPNELPGFYWNDNMTEMTDARNTAELGITPMVLPYGFRCPLFNYLLAGLFTLFPDAEGFLLQRWLAGALDLTAVLVCYFLGREIEGRRFGLLLAAVAAVAKPQIRESLYGCHEITAPLATALCLWSTFRTLRRPGLLPFLAWGLSLSFAVYAYMGCLPLVLFLTLGVLAAILRDPAERGSGVLHWLFPASAAFVTLYFFLIEVNIIEAGTFLHDLGRPLWVQAAVVAFLGIASMTRLGLVRPDGRGKNLFRWFGALLLAWLATLPLTRHPDFGRPVERLLVLDGEHWSDYFPLLGEGVRNTFLSFFLGRGEYGDSAYDLPDSTAFLLGLACFLARPDRRKTFLFLALGACLLPFVLAINPHHARVMPAVIPVALFAALALERLAGLLPKAFGREPGSRAWMAAAVLFVGLTGLDNYRSLYHGWASHENGSTLCAKVIREDSPEREVVLLGGAHATSSVEVVATLTDGHPFRYSNGGFTLHLWPFEKLRDLEILLGGRGEELRTRITHQYPEVRWTPLNLSPHAAGRPQVRPRGPAEWIPLPGSWPQGDEDSPLIWRGVIPAGSLGEGDGRLFQFRRLKEDEWRIRVHWMKDGLGHGPFWWETVADSETAAFPPIRGEILRLERQVHLQAGGTYRFTLRDVRFLDGSMNGERFLKARPGDGDAVGTLWLPAGIHTLSLLVYRKLQGPLPPLKIEGPLPIR